MPRPSQAGGPRGRDEHSAVEILEKRKRRMERLEADDALPQHERWSDLYAAWPKIEAKWAELEAAGAVPDEVGDSLQDE